MLKQIRKLNQDAFTIIEVMIVLAIAGMIILVVLLAVPAVQRNSRNTAIKNDASAVAGGITEFESNNNGNVPTAIAGTGTVSISGTGTTTQAKVQGGTVVTSLAATGTVPAATGPAAGSIVVYLGHKCTASGTYTPGTAGDTNTRSAAVYYSTETSSGLQQQCLDT